MVVDWRTTFRGRPSGLLTTGVELGWTSFRGRPRGPFTGSSTDFGLPLRVLDKSRSLGALPLSFKNPKFRLPGSTKGRFNSVKMDSSVSPAIRAQWPFDFAEPVAIDEFGERSGPEGEDVEGGVEFDSCHCHSPKSSRCIPSFLALSIMSV